MSGSTAWQIPLQANAALAQPDTGKAMSLASFASDLQQKAQQQQRQNTLRSILGAPGAVDPATGLPKPDTFAAVMAVDPATGMQLQQNALAMQGERAKAQKAQLDRYSDIQEAVSPLRTSALAAYTAALPQGPEAAQRAGQAALDEGRPTLVNGGGLSPDEARNVPTKFDYPTFSQRDKQWQDMQAKQRDETRKDRDETRKDIDTTLKVKKSDTVTPAQEADREIRSVADGAIAEQNTTRAASNLPPLTPTEEDNVRVLTRAKAKAAGSGPADDTPMDQRAVDYAATIYRDKGTMPSFGNSRYAVTDRKRIINRAAEMAEQAGTGAGGDIVKQAGVKADAASLAQTTRYRNQVESFEETAQNSAKLIRELAPKGLGPTGVPAFDSWLQAGRKAEGNPDVVKFGNAIDTFTSEYAKIMSGSTGAAGSTDSARAKAERLINKAQNSEQLYGALDVMQREMNIRRKSLVDQEAQIRRDLSAEAGAAADTGGGRASSGASNPRAATDQGSLPSVGVLPGKLFLNEAIAPKVTAGSPRPFAPGEYVQNPNGSWSSEITTTTGKNDFPNLNGGRPTVIPTLWLVDGKPTRVSEDKAAELAAKSGLKFPSFDTEKQAEDFSQRREDSWQSVQPTQAAKIPSLWNVGALPTPDAKGQYDLSKLSHDDLDTLVPTLPAGATFVGPDGKTYRKP